MKPSTERDVWERIARTEKPLCMYGMGDGADKILSVLAQNGITVDDFFASDGFVRGQSFHGKTVASYGALCEKYGDFMILLAFGSALPEVLETVFRLSGERELLAPDVPVSGGELFDMAFFHRHEQELSEVEGLLADARSREVLRNVVEFKLSGDIRFLSGGDAGREDVLTSLLCPERYRTAADLGAYNGDTVRELLAAAPALERVYALEPDRRSYRKLCSFIDENDLGGRVLPCRAAAWENDGEAAFAARGNRNSALAAGGGEQVERRAIDSLAPEVLDYIKLDVEGAEREALLGAAGHIRRAAPDLRVSVYHRSEDLFALPLLVHRMYPEYRLYLRRERYVPAWDVELIATARA